MCIEMVMLPKLANLNHVRSCMLPRICTRMMPKLENVHG